MKTLILLARGRQPIWMSNDMYLWSYRLLVDVYVGLCTLITAIELHGRYVGMLTKAYIPPKKVHTT